MIIDKIVEYLHICACASCDRFQFQVALELQEQIATQTNQAVL